MYRAIPMSRTSNPRGAAQNESMTIVPVSSRWPMASSAAASSSRSSPPPTTAAGRAPKIQAAFSLIRFLGRSGRSRRTLRSDTGQQARRAFLRLPAAPVRAKVRRIPRSSDRRRHSTCHRRCRRWFPRPRCCSSISAFAHSLLLARRPIVPHRRGRREHPRRDPRASRRSMRMVFLYPTFTRDRRGSDRGLMAGTRDNRLGGKLRNRERAIRGTRGPAPRDRRSSTAVCAAHSIPRPATTAPPAVRRWSMPFTRRKGCASSSVPIRRRG